MDSHLTAHSSLTMRCSFAKGIDVNACPVRWIFAAPLVASRDARIKNFLKFRIFGLDGIDVRSKRRRKED